LQKLIFFAKTDIFLTRKLTDNIGMTGIVSAEAENSETVRRGRRRRRRFVAHRPDVTLSHLVKIKDSNSGFYSSSTYYIPHFSR
jgi:hypothetical protein